MDDIRFKKFKIKDPVTWDTHRGGWSYVLEILQAEFHVDDGTLFFSAIEDEMMKGKPIEEPWTGFVHQVPRNNIKGFLDVDRLLRDSTWLKSLKCCQGIFTISKYLKNYLDFKDLPVPVNFVPYALDFRFKAFDCAKFKRGPRKVVFVGEFMRNFQAFFDLKAPDYEKILLSTERFRLTEIALSPSVTIVDRVSDSDYDELLSHSLVFLNLIDAPANTTVIECLGRGTPLLINKLPGVVDYLGENYPYYYSSLEEASSKLSDDKLIEQTSNYLLTWETRATLRKEYFINAIHTSQIYRSLPIPLAQKQDEFNLFDLTVVITSYKRLYNIDSLVDRFCKQEFAGTFELFLWNNNIENAKQLEEIYEKYRDRISIKLIQSTENYYCAIRLTIAHLMQGEYLLICDDDVMPGPNYIQTFWMKLRQYGPEVVLCARGHVFEQHQFDETHPDYVWSSGRHLKFYDESVEDTEIHFFHADNCLIPKSVLLKINTFEWENLDFILVDDYWMSYIISKELELRIIKVRLDTEMHFTDCADDKNIALFHNPHVHEARVGFYAYHMKRGWPNFILPLAHTVSEESSNGKPVKDEVSKSPAETVFHNESRVSKHFRAYDVSVLICTYSRPYNLFKIIEHFRNQDFSGSFELVIWNNNYACVSDVEALYRRYKEGMALKIIHSTKNVFCMPRIAMTSLLRGRRFVFCDDDVIPKDNYLSELTRKHDEFEDDVVVCITGESVSKAATIETISNSVRENNGAKFRKVGQEACYVDYFCANTCVISRHLMKKAAAFRMPTPETALVDNYWLSFIFSREFGVRFVKIPGDRIMTFTDDFFR